MSSESGGGAGVKVGAAVAVGVSVGKEVWVGLGSTFVGCGVGLPVEPGGCGLEAGASVAGMRIAVVGLAGAG
jgi:hypothetical protein